MNQSKETSSAQTNIELACEAVEDMANAIIDARNLPARCLRRQTEAAAQRVVDARTALRDALSGLVTPTLRVIEGGAQPYADDTRPEDRPFCETCKSSTPCSRALQGQCAHWAAAIRDRRTAAGLSCPQ